jgi:hypothetical protein
MMGELEIGNHHLPPKPTQQRKIFKALNLIVHLRKNSEGETHY